MEVSHHLLETPPNKQHFSMSSSQEVPLASCDICWWDHLEVQLETGNQKFSKHRSLRFAVRHADTSVTCEALWSVELQWFLKMKYFSTFTASTCLWRGWTTVGTRKLRCSQNSRRSLMGWSGISDLPNFYVHTETHQLPHSSLGNLKHMGVTKSNMGWCNQWVPSTSLQDW